MKQLLLQNAAIDIWDCSNRYLGMQQLIIENAANKIWECSDQ
jgi:hypothetical protein